MDQNFCGLLRKPQLQQRQVKNGRWGKNFVVFSEYLNFIILVCIFFYKINSTRVSSRNAFLAGHPNFFQFLWFSQKKLSFTFFFYLYKITKYILINQLQIACNFNFSEQVIAKVFYLVKTLRFVLFMALLHFYNYPHFSTTCISRYINFS